MNVLFQTTDSPLEYNARDVKTIDPALHYNVFHSRTTASPVNGNVLHSATTDVAGTTHMLSRPGPTTTS